MLIVVIMSKKPLILVLLETALELVPSPIATHSSVVKTAKRRRKPPTEILLDVSLHYHAMKDLENRHKRGRPDIAHISLLEMLESPLNKAGYLKVAIHTVEGHAIFIDPSTKIPRNYNRFVGLVEQLFKEGRVPPKSEKPLMYIKTVTLSHLLEELGARGLILLREVCERKPISEVVKTAIVEKMAIGIGGFPHGDFEEATIAHANLCYSIHYKPLATFIVVSRVISSAEKLYGLLEI